MTRKALLGLSALFVLAAACLVWAFHGELGATVLAVLGVSVAACIFSAALRNEFAAAMQALVCIVGGAVLLLEAGHRFTSLVLGPPPTVEPPAEPGAALLPQVAAETETAPILLIATAGFLALAAGFAAYRLMHRPRFGVAAESPPPALVRAALSALVAACAVPAALWLMPPQDIWARIALFVCAAGAVLCWIPATRRGLLAQQALIYAGGYASVFLAILSLPFQLLTLPGDFGAGAGWLFLDTAVLFTIGVLAVVLGDLSRRQYRALRQAAPPSGAASARQT